jgi:hypothetical protein
MDSAARRKLKTVLQAIHGVVAQRIAEKRGKAHLLRLARRVRHMSSPAGHEAAVRRLGPDAALFLRVRAALERIENNRFGVCLLCGKRIAPRHLHAVPWAAFCVACRKAVDSREAKPPVSWKPLLSTDTRPPQGNAADRN